MHATTSVLDSERILATFLDLVRLDSPSGQEEPVRRYLQEAFTAMGLTQQTVDAAGNLIIEIPAHCCHHKSTLVLSAHMDVVAPCCNISPVVTGTGNDRLVHSDGKTVLGADDKAALAPLLVALDWLLKTDQPRPRLRLLLTVREEEMLCGAKALDDSALEANFAVTFDHTGEQGTLITQAATYVEYQVTFAGKSVHAGIMPEKGVNAIVYAARVIQQLSLGRIDENTTTNIGLIQGGKGTNVVPDKAVIQGEIRSHDPEAIDREIARLKTLLALEKQNYPGTDYELTYHIAFHGYALDTNHPGVQRVMRAMETTGLTPQLASTAGGSDNNVFVRRGLPGVVLSACFINPHATTEQVKLADMVTCARLMGNMIVAFAQEAF